MYSQRWGWSVRLIVSSKMVSCFLPAPPTIFQYAFTLVILLRCILFSLFDLFNLNNSIKHLFAPYRWWIGLVFLLTFSDETFVPCPWSFIPWDLRTWGYMLGQGCTELSWDLCGWVQDLDFALPQPLLKCSASSFDPGILSLCGSKDMGGFFSLTFDYPSDLRRW